MFSSGKAIGRETGVRGVRKQKPGQARNGSKGRKGDAKKGKVYLLRQGGRKKLQSTKCSGDPACAWPVVDSGLCVFHLRDLHG
jgi:hypothetical protein